MSIRERWRDTLGSTPHRDGMARGSLRRPAMGRAICSLAMALLLGGAVAGRAAEQAAPEVSVHDTGPQHSQASHKGHEGHQWERRAITLDQGAIRYGFQYASCVDPSHGDQRFSLEGALGMPIPSSSNWYHGGFLFITLNGKEVGGFPLSDARVLETGARGAFQMVWEHPDATVGLRLLMPAGANHVLADLKWKPRGGAEIKSVGIRAICYPSYFTSWNKRKGDRHCQTPRIDKREPEILALEPEKDAYLYYYDTIFDVAKGEGEGPCAMMFAPAGIQGGRVAIGDYAVTTELTVKPEANEVRLAFWDFHGVKNADAEAYLKAHAAEDLARLTTLDFRPEPVRQLQADRLKAEATKLLAEAGDGGKPYRASVEKLIAQAGDLQGKAAGGDWKAEADLSGVLTSSTDLFWRLRIAALLNSP